MPYEMKPLACDPAGMKGLSEKIIVSHYENNYGGAVKRLNAIQQQLAGLDWVSAPVFVINGLKREELVAHNSMILHELYFDSLGASTAATPLQARIAETLVAWNSGQASLPRWARHRAAAPAGRCWHGHTGTVNWLTPGQPTTPTTLPGQPPSWHWICTNTATTWITVQPPPNTWRPTWTTSTWRQLPPNLPP